MSVESFAGKINLSLEVKNAGPGLLSYPFLFVVEMKLIVVIPQRLGKRSPFDALNVLFEFSLTAGEKKPCFMVPSIRFTKETLAKFSGISMARKVAFDLSA